MSVLSKVHGYTPRRHSQQRGRIWSAWLVRKVHWAQAQISRLVTSSGIQVYLGASGSTVAAEQYKLANVVMLAIGHLSLKPYWMALVREYVVALYWVERKPQRLEVYRKVLQSGNAVMGELVHLASPLQLVLAFIRYARAKRSRPDAVCIYR